jgi:hypoxanthine-DNA glycosylase
MAGAPDAPGARAVRVRTPTRGVKDGAKSRQKPGAERLPEPFLKVCHEEPLPERLSGLPPEIPPNCTLLILGSFPSAASLAQRQYYAHPQNRFWPIIGACLGVELAAMPYRARLAAANAAGIGIWDVYGACERAGSLDSAIRNAEFNDFARARRAAPGLKRACFNGATAGKALRHLQALGFETAVLPSTSPANASQSFDFKLAQWRAALGAA